VNDTSQILERLERIEAQLAPLTSSAQAIRELRDEMSPRINELVHALIVELADVESDFQLEDLLFLVKKAMRNVNNFNFTLDQLKNLIDLAKTAEPLMKTTVPQMIFYLDDLEQKGVFRLLSTSLEILKNFSAELTGEDLDQMGRGLVRLAGILKKITTPQALDLIDRAADLPDLHCKCTCRQAYSHGQVPRVLLGVVAGGSQRGVARFQQRWPWFRPGRRTRELDGALAD